MTHLALHQITMMRDGPQGLVSFAAEARLEGVCLFTASPQAPDGSAMFPVVSNREKSDFRQLLADNDVRVINAEYFPILPDQEVTTYEPAIALAAALGAKRIVTHVQETDPARKVDQLHQLCASARAHGLEVGLEFTGFAGGCASLTEADALHRDLACDNLGIAIDALHLFRTGGTLEQLAGVDPASICYAQICDGPDFRVSSSYVDEAMNRMIPGDGVFPLAGMLNLLGPHVDIDIEVPWFGAGPTDDLDSWAHRAIAASRTLITNKEPVS